LQIGGFAAKTGTVIHDFAVNFSGGKVNEAQGPASVERGDFAKCDANLIPVELTVYITVTLL
jgi:hypothetical protein